MAAPSLGDLAAALRQVIAKSELNITAHLSAQNVAYFAVIFYRFSQKQQHGKDHHDQAFQLLKADSKIACLVMPTNQANGFGCSISVSGSESMIVARL